jgi:hypothetical protein
MSWLSKGLHKAAKVVSKPIDKTFSALGMGQGNTLRRAIDPTGIMLHKVANGAPINARTVFDPGNEVIAADPKVAAQQAQINPLTGQPGTNARDMIARQMSGATTSGARPVVNPGIGNANSPTYGLGVSNNQNGSMAQIPNGSPPTPSTPPPNYGDISAIMDYVQGKRSGPGSTPMGAPPMGQPDKRPMFGPGRRLT